MTRRLSSRTVLFGGGAALVVAVCGVGSGLAFALDNSSPTPVAPQFVVRDAAGVDSLAVQLQQGVASTGDFDFRVAGVGDWVGVIPLGPVSAQITHLKGTVGAAFQATGQGSTSPAQVRMEGQVDQGHATATVNVWVTLPGATSVTHYLLQTGQPGSDAAATAVVQQVLTALQAEDWSTLYSLSAPEVTQRLTESQYVQMLSSQQHAAVTGATPTGPGSTQVIAGYTYFSQPVAFSSAESGAATSYTAVVSLVWEDGGWKLIGTSTPQPSS